MQNVLKWKEMQKHFVTFLQRESVKNFFPAIFHEIFKFFLFSLVKNKVLDYSASVNTHIEKIQKTGFALREGGGGGGSGRYALVRKI